MILLVNGPNLNLLVAGVGRGAATLADVERQVAEACAAYGVEVRAFQSNAEGALLDFLQRHRAEAQGVVLNPGALAQTSWALHDLLRALPCPTLEVHLDNPAARAPGRRRSVTAAAAAGVVAGLGTDGYRVAALHLCALLARRGAAAGGGAGPEPSPRAPDEGAPSRAGDDAASGARSGAAPPPTAGAVPPEDIPPEGTILPMDLDARGEYEPL